MKKLLLLIALQFIAFHPAHAQQSVIPYCYNSAGTTPITQWIPCSSSVPFPVDVTNSITASLAGWTPAGNYATPLSVSNSSSNVALPTNTGSVALYNTGTVAAYCKLGGSSVAATTSDEFLPGNSAVSYAVGSNTYVACITASSTTTVNISGGSGLLAGFGGGGGAGGSNAAAGTTGSSVPSSASYNGLNLSGTLRGQTGVNPSGSVYAAQNDVSSIAGTTATVNSGAVGAGSLRVAVGQDTSTIAGSAPGTAGTASANVVTVQGVASMTPILANPGTIATWGLVATGGGTAPTNALGMAAEYLSSSPTYTNGQSGALQMTAAGALQVNVANANANGQATMANSSPVAIASNQTLPWTGSSGATAPTSASLGGCIAINAEPTAVTNGQLIGVNCGLTGKTIVLPYANKENAARGAGSSTSTSAITILAASGSASLYEYLTAIQCSRSDAGTSAIYVTINDSASTILVIPDNGGGGGNNVTFPVPIRVALNTAATATPSSGVTTLYCSAQGYYGT